MVNQIYHFLAAEIFQSPKNCNLFDDEVGAVYIFSSLENSILYIGVSKNINKRLKEHRLNLDRFDNKVHHITILTEFFNNSIFGFEESLLNHLRTEYNREPIKNYVKIPKFIK